MSASRLSLLLCTLFASGCGGGFWLIYAGPPVGPIVVGSEAVVAVGLGRAPSDPGETISTKTAKDTAIAVLKASDQVGRVVDLGELPGVKGAELTDAELVEACREAGAHTMIAFDRLESRVSTSTERGEDMNGSTTYQTTRTQELTGTWRILDCAVAGKRIDTRVYRDRDEDRGMAASDRTFAIGTADRPDGFFATGAERVGQRAAFDILGAPIWSRQKLPKGERPFDEAKDAIRRRKWDEAEAHYREVSDDESYPYRSRIAARHGLALVEAGQGDLRAALAIAEPAAKEDVASKHLVEYADWLRDRVRMLDRKQLDVPSKPTEDGDGNR